MRNNRISPQCLLTPSKKTRTYRGVETAAAISRCRRANLFDLASAYGVAVGVAVGVGVGVGVGVVGLIDGLGDGVGGVMRVMFSLIPSRNGCPAELPP